MKRCSQMKHFRSLVVMSDVDACLCLLSRECRLELCLLTPVSEPGPVTALRGPDSRYEAPCRSRAGFFYDDSGAREREPARSANSYLDAITPSLHQPAQIIKEKIRTLQKMKR